MTPDEYHSLRPRPRGFVAASLLKRLDNLPDKPRELTDEEIKLVSKADIDRAEYYLGWPLHGF